MVFRAYDRCILAHSVTLNFRDGDLPLAHLGEDVFDQVLVDGLFLGFHGPPNTSSPPLVYPRNHPQTIRCAEREPLSWSLFFLQQFSSCLLLAWWVFLLLNRL